MSAPATPGPPAVRARPGLADGANCQLFAYEVLRHFGLDAAGAAVERAVGGHGVDHQRVAVPRPLDLVLVNSSRDPWGAHVGVWAGDDKVLHLCAEVGRPALWDLTRCSRPAPATAYWSASNDNGPLRPLSRVSNEACHGGSTNALVSRAGRARLGVAREVRGQRWWRP